MDYSTVMWGVLIAAVACAILYVENRLTYWKRKGVQTLKPLFLIGNAQSMVTSGEGIGLSVHKTTEHFKNLGADYCGFYFTVKPIFIPIKVDLIKRMFVSDFEHFTDRPFTNDDSDPFSCHLFALQGAKWRRMRNKLAPAFTKAKNKMMFPTVKACVDNLVEIVDGISGEGGVLEIKDMSSRLTLDVLASCVFGLDSNSVKNADSEFAFYAREYFSPSLRDTFVRICSIMWPELLPALGVNSIRSDITKFFLRTVDDTIKYREANNVIRNDLMHMLVQIKNNVQIVDSETGDIRTTDKQADALTLNEIGAQCLVFLVAGYESSSSAVSFCLYEMCRNPSFQEQARDEVTAAVKHNGQINFDALSNTPYLEKCVKETMRKYPILPFLSRTCTKTYQVPGTSVTIEKGTVCLISTLSLHKDPETYPNPEEFDPERFSEENVAKRHSLSWIPFGHGPRICIAYQFGLMQTKLTLATLLLNYKFSLNSKTAVPLVLDKSALQTTANDGIWFNVQKVSTEI